MYQPHQRTPLKVVESQSTTNLSSGTGGPSFGLTCQHIVGQTLIFRYLLDP